MNIVITGHSKGIGKELYNYFIYKGHTVYGFSRSNGYDISTEEGINSILEHAVDCDVFINNAYAPQGQTALLNEMLHRWQNSDKTIINISSKATLMPADQLPEFMKEYVAEKNDQHNIIAQQIFTSTPQVINVTLGLVDTEMSEIFKSKKMNAKDVAEFVYTLVDFRDKLAIQSVLIEVPNLSWKDITNGD